MLWKRRHDKTWIGRRALSRHEAFDSKAVAKQQAERVVSIESCRVDDKNDGTKYYFQPPEYPTVKAKFGTLLGTA